VLGIPSLVFAVISADQSPSSGYTALVALSIAHGMLLAPSFRDLDDHLAATCR